VRELRFADLFAGIGGIRLGFAAAAAEAGFRTRCVFSSEIDRKAAETYRLNFHEVPTGDIRTVHALPDIDVLLAGFPCQAFSYAGKQRGFGDTRGTLFFEIERLLREAKRKPKLLLLENVRGFVTHDKGRTHQTVVESLRKLGYHTRTLLLNSANFGVPQNRVRMYMVCVYGAEPRLTLQSDTGPSNSHKYKQAPPILDFFKSATYRATVADVLESDVAAKYLCSTAFTEQLQRALNGAPFARLHGMRLIDYRGGNSLHSWDLGMRGHCTREERELMNAIIGNRRKKVFGEHQDGKELTLSQIKSFFPKKTVKSLLESLVEKGYLRRRSDRYNPTCGNMSFEVFKFLDPESISITVVSSDAHRLGVVNKGAPRRVTPRECARLQSFPDSFVLNPSDAVAYKQLGNSVTVKVIETVFADIFRSNSKLFGSKQ
jgi:DNA (cytosine-5)-methyltransferase 1